jgi:hypothetical protein
MELRVELWYRLPSFDRGPTTSSPSPFVYVSIKTVVSNPKASIWFGRLALNHSPPRRCP